MAPRADQMTIALTDLQSGIVLPGDVYDGRNSKTLLLRSGTTLTPQAIQRLVDRGVSRVTVSKDAFQEVSEGGKPAPSSRAARHAKPASKPRPVDKSMIAQRAEPPQGNYSADLVRQMKDTHAQQKSQLANLFGVVAENVRVSGDVVRSITNTSVDHITKDIDLFVKLSLDPAEDDEVHNHCLRAGQLAMSISYVMARSESEIQEIGTGCLISRLGMTDAARDLSSEPRRLSSMEILEIRKTPNRTFEVLHNLNDVPLNSRQVAYQLFERWNGTGYPRQRAGNQIHALARIAAIADVYVALTSPRPHRPAYEPYKAIEQILTETRRGLYEPAAVRGLLQTVCIFPIGSLVELSDNRIARVIRSNIERYDRPTVEILFDERRRPVRGSSLSLVEHSQISIARHVTEDEFLDYIEEARRGPRQRLLFADADPLEDIEQVALEALG